ncbi:hypothetical protein GXB85_08905 [Cellulomonas sp. APG4]|uniref:hypothetical protein n=1 Tax=Cellulomonas sp. APG4 TaxID=1538656 RepID=UPI00137B16B1|nr:hypothetical protein [Cellulomonas sp. APG4]NCT91065.1 hypothetical protein [Cellulomonas sp. APG4]
MRRTVGTALVVLSLAACTVIGPDGERTDPSPSPSAPPPLTAELRVPEAPVTVVAGADAAARALAASTAFVTSAPLVVLAPPEPDLRLRAASAAVALGVPLLPDDAPGLDEELARLGTEVALTTGTSAEPDEEDDDAQAGGAGAADDAPGATTGTGDGPTSEVDADEGGTADTDTADGSSGDGGDGEATTDLDSGDAAGVEAGSGVELIALPGDPAELAQALGIEAAPVPVAEGGQVDAVTALDRDAPVLLLDAASSTPPASGTDAPDAGAPDDTAAPDEGATTSAGTGSGATDSPSPTSSDDAGDLPAVVQADAVTGATVLTTGAAEDLLALATARAVGATVVRVPGGDPRVDPVVVQTLAGTDDVVLALGGEFGPADELTWKLATARTGVELPGGGQTLFHGTRMVAMYGTPGSGALGVLGEQDVTASVARAQKLARAYRPFTEDTVVPAFEMIVTIASAEAGDDGNYSRELDPATFVPWIEAAQEAGIYVVLDLQPGRTDFLTQAQRYEQLLRYPHVGLALDPEWRLEPDQVHLRQIGSVHVDEVNAVADWLATLTRENALPQKLFVLHQFSLRMIDERERLDTSHAELAPMIHVDGQGSQPAKAGTWTALRQGAPAVAWGWKNFFDEDSPMLTPEQTYQVSPVPELVTYQ